MGPESLQSYWKTYAHKYAQNLSYFHVKVIKLTHTLDYL